MLPVWDWKDFKSDKLGMSETEFFSSFPHPFFIVFAKKANSQFGQLLDSFTDEYSYHFPTAPVTPQKSLKTTTSVQIYELTFDPSWEDPLGIRIGRDAGNELRLQFHCISKLHAVIRKTVDGKLLIVDLGSTNGTTMAGKSLEPNFAHCLGENKKIVFSKQIIGILPSREMLYKMIQVDT